MYFVPYFNDIFTGIIVTAVTLKVVGCKMRKFSGGEGLYCVHLDVAIM
jgi:hypothetical protein